MLVLLAAIRDARVEEDHQSRDANKAVLEVAKGYHAARKGKPHQTPAARPAGPLTLKDQVDLRWMLSRDCQQLMMQADPADRPLSQRRPALRAVAVRCAPAASAGGGGGGA